MASRRHKLNTEVFVIPDGGSYLVYAPLRRCVLRVSGQHVNTLARLRRQEECAENDEPGFLDALVEAGILDGPPERPPPPPRSSYQPTRGTLLLTNRCNLACRYCYASAGTGNLVMDRELGEAAVEYLVQNCLSGKSKVLELGFHGGGEPVMAWEQLTALTDYTIETCRRNGLRPQLGLATNACFSKDKARWIAAHFNHVNVSLDGPPDIQDKARPLRNGGRSSPQIRRTLRVLDEARIPYGIQATITRDTVRQMPRIARYLARYTRATMIKFEPVSECGRFAGQRDHVPSGIEFAQWFEKALQAGERFKARIAFSGLRLDSPHLSHFCGAFAEPFAVTPDGHVSACFEACCAESEFADLFLFGRFDRRTRSFEFDQNKIQLLQQRHVYNLQPCQHCFCKYGCAGDCATRSLRASESRDLRAVGARCEAIREICRLRLGTLVDNVAVKQHQVESKQHVQPGKRKKESNRQFALVR